MRNIRMLNFESIFFDCSDVLGGLSSPINFVGTCSISDQNRVLRLLGKQCDEIQVDMKALDCRF